MKSALFCLLGVCGLVMAAPAQEIARTRSGVEMAMIPAGTFSMGDPLGAGDEGPSHEVQISPFLMDRTEVTQDQFEKTMGYNPSKVENSNHPVDSVRWLEAIEYCNERSVRDGLVPCYDLTTGGCNFAADGYRLPTEAEWEYACRAGTTTRYFSGDNPLGLDPFAWFEKNAVKKSHPVASKKPNAWGLHDMSGSLIEWCNDWYASDAYAAGPAKDPTGPSRGKERVLRGGSWRMKGEECRSAIRFHDAPALPDACFGRDSYGFRCVRRAKEAK